MKTTFVDNVTELERNIYRIRPNIAKVHKLATLLIEESNGECKRWLKIEVTNITYIVDVKLMKETGEQKLK